MTLKKNLDSIQSLAKERTVKTQSIEYDLETLVKKINTGVIKLDPDYQRRHRWSDSMSSKLIESLILNIPIPLIYLSYDLDVDEESEGPRYSVIDGQQRLTAIKKFFDKELIISNLDILTDLEGCTIANLPTFLLRRLEERTIKCLRIDSTIDQQVKFDIFERLNTGSIQLGSQELRNAVYRGKFNDLCKELARNNNFMALLQIDINSREENARVKKMEDVELVIRFFSLCINNGYKNYKKHKGFQFKDFISQKLNEFNKVDELTMNYYKKIFENTFELIYNEFGKKAFAKYKKNNETNTVFEQSTFNAAVYDALSVAVATEIFINNKSFNFIHVQEFINLFLNDDFYEMTNGSILDSSKLMGRIDIARRVFKS